MTLKRLLLVSAASLAFLDSKTVAQDTTKPTLTLQTAKKCLPLLNAARQEADFVNLQESMEDKIAKEGDFDDGSFEGVLCDALLKGKEFKLADAKLTNGTYAFYELTDGSGTLEGNDEQIAVSDCSAAVEKWKGGFSLFGPSPPVKADFKTTDGFSFLTLYNPSASPQGQCKVATCTKGATQQETTKDKGYALVCLTSPSALTQDSIFSDSQWEQIVKALTSSASAVVPSALAFAAVLAGVCLSPPAQSPSENPRDLSTRFKR